MNPQLQIHVCRTYLYEAEAVAHLEQWPDVQIIPFPPLCSSPRSSQPLADQVFEKEQGSGDIVRVGGCFISCRPPASGHYPNPNLAWDQCFYMIASRTQVDLLTQQGGYVFSPGWLAEWRDHFSFWGFDRQTAQEYFHESTRKLVLLDTGVDPESEGRLVELGGYLDLPVEVVSVGLDFFRLFLKQTVLNWRYQHSLQGAEIAYREADRKTADYAMAFDLLTQLTRVMTEEEAIVQILDLFTMLFSFGSVAYCPVVTDQVQESYNCMLEEQGVEDIRDWLASNQEEYCWTPSGNGFILRLIHQDQTVGILRVEGIQFLQYKQQYLNLSLSIARLCGLAISNARTYQRLQEAERTTRKEKDISETFRQIMRELTTHMNLGELLPRILKLLLRVIPFTHAAIFLQQESLLHFSVGIECIPTGEITPLNSPEHPFKMDLSWMGTKIMILEDLNEVASAQKYLDWELVRGWMVVPFMLGGKLMGCLMVGSEKKGAYGEPEASLIQSFANEVTIAIENARLFEEIQQLAITDSLTGMFTRRHFFELGEIEFARSRRYKRPLSMLIIDVDHFKQVNDTYGHAVGDKVLEMVAQCYIQNVRQPDIVGRYGGDEFVLLLPETNLMEAQGLAERLRTQISSVTVQTDQREICVTISLGVASLDSSCADLSDLLRRSDEALLEAKRSGRNSVRVWKPA
jgi:diguanylate cyclase (GGDEF)-like protein